MEASLLPPVSHLPWDTVTLENKGNSCMLTMIRQYRKVTNQFKSHSERNQFFFFFFEALVTEEYSLFQGFPVSKAWNNLGRPE